MNESARWRVLSAEFRTAASTYAQLPKDTMFEAAFVGRSNVGKSSLLNALCGQKALARTSKTPGRTQQFNFFEVRFAECLQSGERLRESSGYFVDVPGFGYAQTSKSLRSSWQKFIEAYLLEREQLSAVCLLLDARRDPGEEEKWISDLGREGGLLPIVTKCDKLKKNEISKRRRLIADALEFPAKELILSSSAPKKHRGLQEIIQRVAESFIQH